MRNNKLLLDLKAALRALIKVPEGMTALEFEKYIDEFYDNLLKEDSVSSAVLMVSLDGEFILKKSEVFAEKFLNNEQKLNEIYTISGENHGALGDASSLFKQINDKIGLIYFIEGTDDILIFGRKYGTDAVVLISNVTKEKEYETCWAYLSDSCQQLINNKYRGLYSLSSLYGPVIYRGYSSSRKNSVNSVNAYAKDDSIYKYLNQFKVEPSTGKIFKNGKTYDGNMVLKGNDYNTARRDIAIRLHAHNNDGKIIDLMPKVYQAVVASAYNYDLNWSYVGNEKTVDHIDCDTCNNAIGNLQAIDRKLNSHLTGVRRKLAELISTIKQGKQLEGILLNIDFLK